MLDLKKEPAQNPPLVSVLDVRLLDLESLYSGMVLIVVRGALHYSQAMG